MNLLLRFQPPGTLFTQFLKNVEGGIEIPRNLFSAVLDVPATHHSPDNQIDTPFGQADFGDAAAVELSVIFFNSVAEDDAGHRHLRRDAQRLPSFNASEDHFGGGRAADKRFANIVSQILRFPVERIAVPDTVRRLARHKSFDNARFP